MLALMMTLSGLALVESLNVLNLGATSAIIYDSRLHRRSPLPGGLSFIAGLFAATAALGIAVVFGVDVLTRLSSFELTPTLRYRSELVVGALLVGVACYPAAARKAAPHWAFTVMRQRPWLLGCVGSALGFGQAATDVVYLGALAMLSAHHPRPWFWPLLVIGYCAVELAPPVLVLLLATRPTPRAQRVQRTVTRVITRYGPRLVRAMCVVAGAALVADAFRHSQHLW
ncbi:GAP family protein [Mycobacterium camsae]|uniref:GAP family protein n=1 Tax=Mycobacterium gordonae TaxID=1778 RepID=UPI00197FE7D2|nr:GAP family protein [Mycobacterium gordonae]